MAYGTAERDPAFKILVMDFQAGERTTLQVSGDGVEVSIAPKRIVTLMVDDTSEE